MRLPAHAVASCLSCYCLLVMHLLSVLHRLLVIALPAAEEGAGR